MNLPEPKCLIIKGKPEHAMDKGKRYFCCDGRKADCEYFIEVSKPLINFYGQFCCYDMVKSK